MGRDWVGPRSPRSSQFRRLAGASGFAMRRDWDRLCALNPQLALRELDSVLFNFGSFAEDG